MSDYKSLPVWKKGMTFAHAVYAAVEAAGLKGSEAGKRLRKAAVSVPSLVGEAFLDLAGGDKEAALSLADAKLAEVESALTQEPDLASIGEEERASLLADVESLRADLEMLREEHRENLAH